MSKQQQQPDITVRSTCSTASARALVKKEAIERELVTMCDVELVRRQAHADRRAARLAARAAKRQQDTGAVA